MLVTIKKTILKPLQICIYIYFPLSIYVHECQMEIKIECFKYF